MQSSSIRRKPSLNGWAKRRWRVQGAAAAVCSSTTEVSLFGPWESRSNLYLLYRIVEPEDDMAASKCCVVKVRNPSLEVCNEIGDHSKLM